MIKDFFGVLWAFIVVIGSYLIVVFMLILFLFVCFVVMVSILNGLINPETLLLGKMVALA